MNLPFSEHPGRHERDYRRRLDNPLFGHRATLADPAQLLEAQRLDHEELLSFLSALRATVGHAAALKPTEDSDVILRLKEQLDKLFETSAGLAEDHSENQAALRQLLAVVMRKVELGAVGDPQAMAELANEHAAREAHFALLKSPLVADLLHPESIIDREDLVPTLLSVSADELGLALQLFDVAQLQQIEFQVRELLRKVTTLSPDAVARADQISTWLLTMHSDLPAAS